ncbi:MAG: hypothetical protein ACYTDT_05830 [Planctomycetota bacterium]|jgi:hypothetical protein
MRNWSIFVLLAVFCTGLAASEPLNFDDFRQLKRGGGGKHRGWVGPTMGLSVDRTFHGEGQAMSWISLSTGIPYGKHFGQVVRTGWGAGGEVPAPNKTGQRSRDPDVFGYYFESGLRLHLELIPQFIGVYAEAGASYAHMTRDETAGTSDNFGLFASVGIELGMRYIRFYVETGARGLIPMIYSDNEIRNSNSFHWMAFRIGIRGILP